MVSSENQHKTGKSAWINIDDPYAHTMIEAVNTAVSYTHLDVYKRQEILNVDDPVLMYDRFMEEIDLKKYLRDIPTRGAGRPRYNPVNMLKTIIYGCLLYTSVNL